MTSNNQQRQSKIYSSEFIGKKDYINELPLLSSSNQLALDVNTEIQTLDLVSTDCSVPFFEFEANLMGMIKDQESLLSMLLIDRKKETDVNEGTTTSLEENESIKEFLIKPRLKKSESPVSLSKIEKTQHNEASNIETNTVANIFLERDSLKDHGYLNLEESEKYIKINKFNYKKSLSQMFGLDNKITETNKEDNNFSCSREEQISLINEIFELNIAETKNLKHPRRPFVKSRKIIELEYLDNAMYSSLVYAKLINNTSKDGDEVYMKQKADASNTKAKKILKSTTENEYEVYAQKASPENMSQSETIIMNKIGDFGRKPELEKKRKYIGILNYQSIFSIDKAIILSKNPDLQKVHRIQKQTKPVKIIKD